MGGSLPPLDGSPRNASPDGHQVPVGGRGRSAWLVAAAVGLVAGLAGAAVALGIDRATEGSGATTSAVSQVTTTAAAASTADASVAFRSWTPVVRRVSPGVVTILSTMLVDVPAPPGFPSPGQQEETALGSGFVLDRQGHIVTAQHVVSDAKTITVRFADGTGAKATLAGADASTDLAVIKVDVAASRLHPLTLGFGGLLQVGEPVLAIGDPFGYEGSASAGIVSGLGREMVAPNGR